ncbi:penicillin-binding protein 2 [Bacteroidota bacterium]
MSKQSYSNRKYIILAIVFVIGFIFLLRLFYIQVIDNSYVLSARENVLRYITQYPARGLIYDRNGKLLVYNEATYDLMVVPNELSFFDTTELIHLLGIEKEQVIERFKKAKSYSPFLPSIFEKQITKESYGYLQEKLYKFPGFFVQTRTIRKYPIPHAAHILGYIGEVSPAITESNKYYKPGDYIGISGIEKSYEEILKGNKGIKIVIRDNLNREKGSFQNGKYDTVSIAGYDLFTSLDADIQAYGEYLMQNKKGSIVAIEPGSGEILTLVSSPAYDPNLLVGRVRGENYLLLSHDSLKPLYNRALMAQYPPGSTFKIVMALVGQQEGVLFPSTLYSCQSGYHAGGLTVGCHVHASPLNLPNSIKNSCNAYYCRVFRSVIDNPKYSSTEKGFNAWRKHILSFGFGKRFNSDLPNELNGNIPTAAYYDKYHGNGRWKSLTIISLAIGQGEILFTPIQLANLAAITANKGYYYTPHIVKAIGEKNNLNKSFEEKNHTNIDPSYFDIVIEGMAGVVLPGGTARRGFIDGIEVCGKTGTAENPHGKDHSIFMAFAPKENPKIAIAVIVENTGDFGGTWAAPIASLMIEKYLTGTIKNKYKEERIVNANFLINY